ncbi:MAG: Fic family protein [Anaerolineaceae bacterium]|nr:Fic family protein [Anaerolineaceae bacterium]
MDPKNFPNPDTGRVVLTPNGFWAFLPNPLPPNLNWSLPLVSMLSEAERNLSRLSTLIGNFPFPRLLLQPLIRNEAVISSRIEGTQASLIDLYTFETDRRPSADVLQVYNYVQAMDYGLDRLKTLPVSLRLIRELHEKLFANIHAGVITPGEFRRSQNWIGPAGSTPSNAAFVPPPVDEMQLALDSLEKFIHSDVKIPALVRAGMIHYQFEAIHPFLDGNGRVGRLLIELLLCEWGLLPQPLLNLSTYIEHYRQEYYDHLLAVSQTGAWETWLRFFLRGISEQSLQDIARMERLEAIRAKFQTIMLVPNTERNPPRMSAFVDFLFTRPVLSVRQASLELAVPFKTARDYIEKLERAAILREITGFARNRIYQSDEILKAIQGLE